MYEQRFLIDTDIIIDYLKEKYSINEKIKAVGLHNCFVSEITIAELLYGALKSSNPKKAAKEHLKSSISF